MTTIPQLQPRTWHAGTAAKYSGIAAGHNGTQPAAATKENNPIDSLSGKGITSENVSNHVSFQLYLDISSSLPLILSFLADPRLL